MSGVNGRFLFQVSGHPGYGLAWGQIGWFRSSSQRAPCCNSAGLFASEAGRDARHVRDTAGRHPISSSDRLLPENLRGHNFVRDRYSPRQGGRVPSVEIQLHGQFLSQWGLPANGEYYRGFASALQGIFASKIFFDTRDEYLSQSDATVSFTAPRNRMATYGIDVDQIVPELADDFVFGSLTNRTLQMDAGLVLSQHVARDLIY